MNIDLARKQSLDYLASSAAQESLDSDAYWPKWDSPWWHMLLLHEMGETKLIPESAIRAMVRAVNRYPLRTFPFAESALLPGMDMYRDVPCHCALGSIYQVLSAWGIEVDKQIPWIKPWLFRYQMADGGLSCDGSAYLVKNEVPSSMVGLMAAFEAVLLHTKRPFSAEEEAFLERGAAFLIGRRLSEGSATEHNAEERTEAQGWASPFFPRFYFYDTLRGLRALLLWSEKMKRPIPEGSIAGVVMALRKRFLEFPGINAGKDYAGAWSTEVSGSGAWHPAPARVFSLLEACNRPGGFSLYLAGQWAEVEKLIAANPWLEALRGA